MKVTVYSITFLLVLFYSLYQGNTFISISPFSIRMEHPWALVYLPIALLIWILILYVYWTGFTKGRKEGLKECEEIYQIGKEADKK